MVRQAANTQPSRGMQLCEMFNMHRELIAKGRATKGNIFYDPDVDSSMEMYNVQRSVEVGEISCRQYGLEPHEYAPVVNALRKKWLDYMMKQAFVGQRLHMRLDGGVECYCIVVKFPVISSSGFFVRKLLKLPYMQLNLSVVQ
ncbi:hypothetical protein IFM89_024822 [Coptis chinensis]|uniref:Uncharacterized protein n=1 Tax=Coptis chinensis TaxID=261450 RepID=A0A835IEF2_9MAGN|nr:hypothetical protein IFM89_024822 [Coptis chinensis]